MNVKVNDNVLVIAGKDKGVQGKVLATSPKANTVTVEGVRVQKKHQKARRANESSQIKEVPGPIDASNVKVVCPACGKATRVKHAIVDGKRLRFSGDGASLFGNYFVWMLLTVVTCGIYSFWVAPKLYQWIVSNIHFDE